MTQGHIGALILQIRSIWIMNDKIELSISEAAGLIEEFGSPLYVYDEEILKKRCTEIRGMLKYKFFVPNYSAKANSNIELLKIIHGQGFTVDAMSPGEIFTELEAGFTPNEILFVSNNVTHEEMDLATELGVRISLDSLTQLEMFGKRHRGAECAVRLNPGIGDGGNEKIITGGHSKFGIMFDQIPELKRIADEYDLHIVGINQHIGSLFYDTEKYVSACRELLSHAMDFKELEFIDFGGGFGIPYRYRHPEERPDLHEIGSHMDELIEGFVSSYGRDIRFKVEPGRYIVAECCQLLGTVTSEKISYGEKYIGTDIGFNVLVRPVLYDAYHYIVVYNHETEEETVNIVGNICESGDILAKQRRLQKMAPGDIIGIRDTGAYGYSMASNYNSRLRPAEVLINRSTGERRLIRRRDTYEDLIRNMKF